MVASEDVISTERCAKGGSYAPPVDCVLWMVPVLYRARCDVQETERDVVCVLAIIGQAGWQFCHFCDYAATLLSCSPGLCASFHHHGTSHRTPPRSSNKRAQG